MGKYYQRGGKYVDLSVCVWQERNILKGKCVVIQLTLPFCSNKETDM